MEQMKQKQKLMEFIPTDQQTDEDRNIEFIKTAQQYADTFGKRFSLPSICDFEKCQRAMRKAIETGEPANLNDIRVQSRTVI